MRSRGFVEGAPLLTRQRGHLAQVLQYIVPDARAACFRCEQRENDGGRGKIAGHTSHSQPRREMSTEEF